MVANRNAVISTIVAGICSSGPSTAAAQERAGLALHWEAPVGCPQESEVRNRIRALAPSLESPDLHLRADGTITRIDARFRLKLVVSDGQSSGERVIESTSCAGLAQAAALALRLLAHLEPESESEPPAPSPTRPKPPGPPPAPPSSTAKATTPEPPKPDAPARRWGPVLRAPLVAGDIGPLPSPSVGIGLAIGWRADGWRFLVSGYISSERTIWSTVPGYGVEVGRAAGELSACRGLRSGRVEFAPCVVVGIERMSARGFGDNIVPISEAPILPRVGADVLVYWYPSNWVAPFVASGARIQTSRPTISLDQIGTVYRVAAAAFTLSIGSEWIF